MSLFGLLQLYPLGDTSIHSILYRCLLLYCWSGWHARIVDLIQAVAGATAVATAALLRLAVAAGMRWHALPS